MQLPGKAIQPFGPGGFQLLLHQLLGFLVIFDPYEAIALLPVFQPVPVHLPGQPFAPVQSHLNIKGKPGLNARVHPSQFRVDLVVIQHVARSPPPDNVSPAVLESRAGLHGADDTYPPAVDLVLRGEAARPVVLVHVGRRLKHHLPLVQSLQRLLLQPLTHALHMFLVILE